MILFTADWHIKLGQKNVPKSWALNRYNLFFEQVHQIDCDWHIVGGDIFDRIPTMEELCLYFKFIRQTSVPTLIYDGNHEATKKNHTFFSQLKEASKAINPLVTIIDEPDIGGIFNILPYCYLHQKNIIEQLPTTRPLFTHVRGEIPPHVKPEIDLNRLNKFPVVFAGDLHAHSNTQRNIVYPGSPMTTSFHRTKVETGYLLIDELDWSWEWKKFDLPQLIRKTVQLPSEMISTPVDHTIYELEGDLLSLSKVKNSELLDKKVIKRNVETSLILDKNMTMQDELAKYLLYILELEEEQVKDLIGVFNDYT
jgi:DNA repair exonuclease SbcCD nuclease subunit